MNRREMLGGLGVAALTAACGGAGPQSTTTSAAVKGGAKAIAGGVRLRMGFVGLCAFLRDGSHYKAGLLDATGVKDPKGDFLKAHKPIILIDSRVVDPSVGTKVEGKDYRLFTDTKEFQKLSLKDYDLLVDGLGAESTVTGLSGIVPLAIYNTTVRPDWASQQFTQAVVTIQEGQLVSGIPRQTTNGIEKLSWKLSGVAAENGAVWDTLPDIPRLLSDTVEYHALVGTDSKIILTPRKGGSNVEIPTSAKTDLEIWVINLPDPNEHTQYEMDRPWELQHIRAFSQLLKDPPTKMLVPIARKEGYPGLDPIYCPPTGD